MNRLLHTNSQLPKLELDKKRFRVKQCPCGKSNKDGKFVPYVGYENKGYCHSCGETFLPELQNHKYEVYQHHAKKPITKPIPITYIPIKVFRNSLKHYELNNLSSYLINLFGVEITKGLIQKYFIGTSSHWQCATVFWQIDFSSKIRAGKIMLYSPDTGKRFKEPNSITWVHKALKLPDFALKQCLFGEHLLRGNSKPVAIVESEKTAIIASVYLPQFAWLATGGLANLSSEMCKTLKGKKVILFPDLNGYVKWNNKVKELSHLARFSISDLLERKATEEEKKQGLDLADFLIRHDYRDFSKAQSIEPEIEQPQVKQPNIHFDEYVNNLTIENKELMAEGYPASWDLTAPYLDSQTKDFIKLVSKNPVILKLQQRLKLTLNTT